MDSVLSPQNLLSCEDATAQMRQEIELLATRADADPAGLITRVELPVHAADILGWLARVQTRQKFYWSDRGQDFESGAAGVSEHLVGDSSSGRAGILKTIRIRLEDGHPRSRYYGGFAFHPDCLGPEWGAFSGNSLFLPRFEITKEAGQSFFACNLLQEDINNPCRLEEILGSLTAFSFPQARPRASLNINEGRRDAPSQAEWIGSLEALIPQLGNGDLQKIVLARRSTFPLAKTGNAFELMSILRQTMPQCFHFCFQPDDGVAFFGASPERLYRRENRTILTEAIAGTRPRSEFQEKDEQLRKDLCSSQKDLQEHQFVVSAIERALKGLCSGFPTGAETSLLTFAGGHHLCSRFEGELKAHIQDEDILAALHPTPAVGGWPLKNAMERIAALESFSRGWYAGPIGYIGREASEFAVAIRSGLITPSELLLFAGAGIVPGSNPRDEWDEVEEKMKSLLKAFPG